MAGHFDVIVVGGGPAGSAAAWQAASGGARVLVLDKADFPRDKPCGDGLTPGAVRQLAAMGITNELEVFHKVDHVRIFAAGHVLERQWPVRDGSPAHGYVAPRRVLDELLLRHAAAAGAEVRESAEVVGPIVEGGLIRGALVREEDAEYEVHGTLVVAADGSQSRFCRHIGMAPRGSRPLGVAIRAEVKSNRPDDSFVEFYLDLRYERAIVPGYGWVFPMGGGTLNIGVGLVSASGRWKGVNTAQLMEAFLASLPTGWDLPSVQQLLRSGCLKGRTLPMGLAVWPPWRPGLLAVGDAAGVAKPFTGVGISKALESGLIAGQVALEALMLGDPTNLSQYEHRINALWGSYYRLGRIFLRLVDQPKILKVLVSAGMVVPRASSFFQKLIVNVYREKGGTASDASIRALLKMASLPDERWAESLKTVGGRRSWSGSKRPRANARRKLLAGTRVHEPAAGSLRQKANKLIRRLA